MEHDGCKGCKYEKCSEDSKECRGCKQNAVDKYTRMTQADHIRSMSDEELAVSRVDRIDFYTKSDIPEYIGDFAGIANSIEEAIALEIKWLQSEVEEIR